MMVASIEHQIDIHVLDLTDQRDSIIEVLHGLKYCMEFRIKVTLTAMQ